MVQEHERIIDWQRKLSSERVKNMELSRRQALLGGLAVAVAPAAPTLLSGRELAKLICETQPMKVESEDLWASYKYSVMSAAMLAGLMEIQKKEDASLFKTIGVEGMRFDEP
jgi:cytochrome bd-type quinol oxidase subunit 1